MNAALVLVSNGRGDLLEQTVRAIRQHVRPLPETTLICDDSGDPAYARRLREHFPDAIIDPHRHMGHGPAVARAWRAASTLGTDWVLWMEEDMAFAQDVDLESVAGVIEQTGIVQMVFLRNSHFPPEVMAGPTQLSRFDRALFHDRETNGHPWLLHRQFYSLNPHLVPREFLEGHRWPALPNSEHHFSRRLFRGHDVSVGVWGRWDDPPTVLHLGTERTGSGY